MAQNKVTNIDRIIAKIDNDFNPDNSDWIPRVGAWVHDALGILDYDNTKRVKEKFVVKDRIAYSKCELKGKLKVYDKNGCEIKEYDDIKDNACCGSQSIHSTGGQIEVIAENSSGTTSIIHNSSPSEVPTDVITKQINGGDGSRYNVIEIFANKSNIQNKNYVLIDCKNIELNFDTDYIIVEHDEIKTCHSDIYNCDFPEIPNNGKVIEYLAYYCMYKMLCRGFKHPVFNLSASQYGTNPYYIFKSMEDEAKRSLINDNVDENLTNLWRSAFFIGAFNPRK